MTTNLEPTWTVVRDDLTDVQLTISGLQTSSTYEFRVTAVNVAGSGQPSDSVTVPTDGGLSTRSTGLVFSSVTSYYLS